MIARRGRHQALVVSVSAKAIGVTPKGRVYIRIAGRKVSSGRLHGHHVRTTLPGFTKPGTYRLVVQYSGSKKVFGSRRTITVHVTG